MTPSARYTHGRQCYYVCISDTSSSNQGHVKTRIESPVRRVVVSPNDKITAFLLGGFRDGKRSWRLALHHTEDILKLSMQR